MLKAQAAGAPLVTRERSGELAEGFGQGSFAAPALLVDVPDQVRPARVEVFGPAAGIFRFQTEEEALERANATEMGLAAYLYTSSLDRAWRMSEALDAGIVGLNNALPSVAFAPMGGVNQSGLGREGSHQGLEEFLEVKYLSLEL